MIGTLVYVLGLILAYLIGVAVGKNFSTKEIKIVNYYLPARKK